MKSFLFIILIFLFISCNERREPLPVLDFEAALKYPQPLDISRIAEKIDYIGLETREECLLSHFSVHKRDTSLYIKTGNYFNGHIYRFSLSGQFIGSIGSPGSGPEEYDELLYVNVSPDGKWVYAMTRDDILKYTSTGDFAERIPFKRLSGSRPVQSIIDAQGRWFFRCLEAGLKDEALLVCDSSFHFLGGFRRQVIRPTKGVVPMDQSVAYDGDYVYYYEPLGDTLYGINADLERKPMAIVQLGSEQPQLESFDSFSKLDGKRLFGSFQFMKNLWFFRNGSDFFKAYTDWFVYLKPSSELIYLKNSYIEWDHVNWLPAGYNPDEWIWRADMVSLLDNRDKITDPQLKALAMQVDENSNPIIAVVKLKKKFD